MHGPVTVPAAARPRPPFWRSRRVRRRLTVAWFAALVTVFAVTQVGAAGTSGGAARTAPSTIGPGALSRDEQAATVRVAEIVRRVQPVVADGAQRCLEAGVACAGDDLLALDTTRLRARSLGAGLTAAVEPGTPAYLGRAGGATTELAASTSVAATGVADALDRWLDSGCAAERDGVAVASRPAECPDWAGDATTRLASFSELLARWPE